MKIFAYLLAASICFAACKNNSSDSADNNISGTTNEPAAIGYQVINKYPHDTSSFTEGLIWHDNYLYESTGNKGQSFLRKNNLKNGKSVQEIKLPAAFFGEGIAILNNKIYQLTWQEHKVFIYDLATFKKIGELSWPQQGWGMTTDGKSLILTTGDSNLYYINPADFSIQKTVGVTDNFGPVSDLNEVEYVDGFIYVNLWHHNEIYKVNPETGAVVGKIDLTDINSKNGVNFTPHEEAVLNGIAYNPVTKTLYVTGKNWPEIFELKLQ